MISTAVINNLMKFMLSRKGFIWFIDYSPSSEEAKAGALGRKPKQELNSGQGLRAGPGSRNNESRDHRGILLIGFLFM